MLLALVHTLVSEGLARPGLPRELLHRLRARAALSDGRERRPAEGCRLGGGHHRRSGRHHPCAGAPHGGDAHDDHRVMVAAARRSWRAAVLGGDPAGVGARPDRTAGRRVRLRLWLRRRHCRAAAGLRARRRWTASAIRSASRSRRRASPIACCTRARAYDFNGKHGTYPDIRLVYWAGGNPFHHHQDTNKLRRAWRRPETIIVHEPWWTATARHADIVLPATTTLERNDIGGARARPVRHRNAAGDRAGRRGAQRLSRFSASWRAGSAATSLHARPRRDGLAAPSLRSLARQHPHQPGGHSGFRPVLGGRLSGNPAARRRICAASPTSAPIRSSTSSRRRRAASSSTPRRSPVSAMTIARRMRPGSSRAEWLGGEPPRPIRCISSPASRAIACTARWTRSRQRARQGGRPRGGRHQSGRREARGIGDGDVVRVHNARGACLAGAVVSDTMSPGVVQLSCGAWYDPAEAPRRRSARTAMPMC